MLHGQANLGKDDLDTYLPIQDPKSQGSPIEEYVAEVKQHTHIRHGWEQHSVEFWSLRWGATTESTPATGGPAYDFHNSPPRKGRLARRKAYRPTSCQPCTEAGHMDVCEILSPSAQLKFIQCLAWQTMIDDIPVTWSVVSSSPSTTHSIPTRRGQLWK